MSPFRPDTHACPPAAQWTVESIVLPKPHVGAPIDANGNLISDGTRTFEWDARNQLVAANLGRIGVSLRNDSLQRLGRIVTKENGITQSDTKVVWCAAWS